MHAPRSRILVHNLPPRPHSRLIGRDREVEEIKQRLAPTSHDWIIPIQGHAGSGKSALALEVAWQVYEADAAVPVVERFDAIIWASARGNTGAELGRLPTKATLTSLDEVVDAITFVLDAPQLCRRPRDQQPRALVQALRQYGRVLLILDQLEVEPEPAIVDFLRTIPQPSKAIVTLRFHEDMPFPISLATLDERHMRQLVAEEGRQRGLTFTEQQIASLAADLGGLPLAAHLLLGLFQDVRQDEHLLQRLTRRRKSGDDLLHDMLSRAANVLRVSPDPTFFAFLALTFFHSDVGATPDALAATLGVEPRACRAALARLSRLNLALPALTDKRVRMLPVARRFAQEELAGYAEWHKEARRRWIACYRELVAVGDERFLSAEYPNLLRVMDWLMTHNEMTELAWFFDHLQMYLFAQGHWDQLLKVADHLLTWAEATEQPQALIALLQAPISVFARRNGLVQRGRDWLERVRRATTRLHDRLFDTELSLADARLRYDRDTCAALPALDPKAPPPDFATSVTGTLDFYTQRGFHHKALQTLLTLGNYYRWRRRYDEAERCYSRALSQLPTAFAGDANSLTAWRSVLQVKLGLMLGRQGQYAKATRLISDAVGSLSEVADQAEGYAALALYERRLNHHDKAANARAKADERIARLQLERPICWEDEQWLQG